MEYLSTRDSTLRFSAAEAIKMGLSRDGGLFVPGSFPTFSALELDALCDMPYPRRAAYVMGRFLDDFSMEELESYAASAYRNFDCTPAAPLRQVSGNTWYLELWHGPTSAFKDMALQILPYLLTASLRKTGEDGTACILTATSGDTGKAAMAGFAGVERTKIFVFYPENGVSDIQKLQMVTQEGGNVGVCAVRGNFDDAQNGVKAIFSDPALREELRARGYFLSSANSINWGRVLPQIAYYVSAYCDLLDARAVKLGEKVNICVPTGNFGNILAAYYAYKMGLPVGKLICASNCNDVLKEFLRTGLYNRNRPFHTTMSPSMDILISSNLERLLYDLSGGDDGQVRDYMAQLAEAGWYKANGALLEKLRGLFYAGSCGEVETAATIGEVYNKEGYLIDPHTAVAAKVLGDYRRETGDRTPAIVVSTASPFKFCGSVLRAIGEIPVQDGVDQLEQLEAAAGVAAPVGLLELRMKQVRFTGVADRDRMADVVKDFLR